MEPIHNTYSYIFSCIRYAVAAGKLCRQAYAEPQSRLSPLNKSALLSQTMYLRTFPAQERGILSCHAWLALFKCRRSFSSPTSQLKTENAHHVCLRGEHTRKSAKVLIRSIEG